jgi:hypothetical protein
VVWEGGAARLLPIPISVEMVAMNFKILSLIVLVVLYGCGHHSRHNEPDNNKDFYRISDIKELEGVYKNEGEPLGYLSSIIWGYSIRTDNGIARHEDIEYVEVIISDSILVAKAIKNGCSVNEKLYKIGRDIKISNGSISVNTDASLLNDGRYIVGPSYRNITIGLDEDKNGKYRRSSYEAGLFLMVVPISTSDIDEVRYERVSRNPIGFPSCTNANKSLNSTSKNGAN